MIDVQKQFKVDGNIYVVVAKDVGSVAEGIGILQQYETEVGAAPSTPVSATEVPRPRKGRPPKGSPMAVTEPTTESVPTLPAGVERAFPPSGAAMVLDTPPVATSAPATAAVVPSAPQPAAPPVFTPPPPPGAPIVTEEEATRLECNREIAALFASIPMPWMQSVQSVVHNFKLQHGDPDQALPLANARALLEAVRGYRKTCDAAPR